MGNVIRHRNKISCDLWTNAKMFAGPVYTRTSWYIWMWRRLIRQFEAIFVSIAQCGCIPWNVNVIVLSISIWKVCISVSDLRIVATDMSCHSVNNNLIAHHCHCCDTHFHRSEAANDKTKNEKEKYSTWTSTFSTDVWFRNDIITLYERCRTQNTDNRQTEWKHWPQSLLYINVFTIIMNNEMGILLSLSWLNLKYTRWLAQSAVAAAIKWTCHYWGLQRDTINGGRGVFDSIWLNLWIRKWLKFNYDHRAHTMSPCSRRVIEWTNSSRLALDSSKVKRMKEKCNTRLDYNLK